MKIPHKQLADAQVVTSLTYLSAADRVVADVSGGGYGVHLPDNPLPGETVTVYNSNWTVTDFPSVMAAPLNFTTGLAVYNPTPDIYYVVFVFNGTEWEIYPTALTSGTGYATFVSDSPPVAPSQGDLWFNSDTFDLSVWYSDGTDAAWVKLSGLSGNTPPSNPVVDNYVLVATASYSMSMTGDGTYPRTYIRYEDPLLAECRGGAENDLDTSTGVFTAPFSGMYHVTATADIYRGSGTAESYLNLQDDNGVFYQAGGFGVVNPVMSTEVYIPQGGTLRVYTAGTSAATRGQSSYNNRLTIRYMGA